jgi:serine phosphatase RsbU (regulator of sigma subunit)
MPQGIERRPELEDRLDAIKSVTDADLSILDVDNLLAELLERVVDLLEADTAAILLTDASGQELVARAARGIEEEVRQGVRVPIGRGFAGRVAATRAPVVLDHVDESTVSNPILWEKGIKAMLGVPLVSSGELIGVLHVGTLRERHFDEGDIELMQLVAERVAGAVRMRLLEAGRDAAEALQRSLIPSAPPNLAGIEIAARYVPAEHGNIGGDWYDVFRLDDGTIWVVTGDVAGHGLQAAVVMGRVRSALRAYALLGAGPDEVLGQVDRKMQHFEVGQMATVVAAVLSPPYHVARIAVAGHPPAVLAAPGGSSELVSGPIGPPIGQGLEHRWPLISVPFERGAVLFFYTDGLVERRNEAIDYGIERVRTLVVADRPDVVCQRVMAGLVGVREPNDDIAVLALRRNE